jgi:hypothetical protein
MAKPVTRTAKMPWKTQGVWSQIRVTATEEIPAKPEIFQRFAYLVCKQEVTGSIPVGSTGEVPAREQVSGSSAALVDGPAAHWSSTLVIKPEVVGGATA